MCIFISIFPFFFFLKLTLFLNPPQQEVHGDLGSLPQVEMDVG